MSFVPRAAPLHLQPPPSVPREKLASLGIQYLSPVMVRDMVYERNRGRCSFAIVDLRDQDFVGGHIPGCNHLASRSFYGNIDGAIARLQWAPLVVFHCLISMHRAPMCAKLYKERLMQLGRHQDVAILEGGFSQWRDLFSGQPELIEDEALDSFGAQQQYALGFGLGQQFVQDVQNGGYGPFHAGSFHAGNEFQRSNSIGFGQSFGDYGYNRRDFGPHSSPSYRGYGPPRQPQDDDWCSLQ